MAKVSSESSISDTPSGVVSAETFASIDGLEFLQRIRDGQFPPPPIAALLGLRIVEAETGRTVFTARPDSRLYNPMGAVHGGYMATLLDSCMGCAVHSKLKAGQGYTTVELKVSYVRPLTEETGEVRAEGKIIHAGRQIATAEGRLTDSSGRLLAHASTTCLIFTLPRANT
jgi:uncharacterized protein (TIGR00369 family)